jgi:hypothetical protein
MADPAPSMQRNTLLFLFVFICLLGPVFHVVPLFSERDQIEAGSTIDLKDAEPATFEDDLFLLQKQEAQTEKTEAIRVRITGGNKILSRPLNPQLPPPRNF